MSKVVMCDLLGDDDLMADNEAVLEAVTGWIKGGGGEEGHGERLLGLIRYGLLTASRLEEVGLRAEEMVGEGLGAHLRALANEALARQQLPSVVQWGRSMGSCAAQPSSIGIGSMGWCRTRGMPWLCAKAGGACSAGFRMAACLNGMRRLWRSGGS